MRRTILVHSKSIAGAALVGLGLFILCANLPDAAARFGHLAGIRTDASQTFGEMIAVVLAASHVVQSYLFDRGEFLRGLCRILISFWPLLLVSAGMRLTGTSSRAESKNFQKIQGRRRSHRRSFDASVEQGSSGSGSSGIRC
jgi:hypothetical protein